MTFEANINKALRPFHSIQEQHNLCFECGTEITKGFVRYDGYFAQENIKSISLHPSCATVVAQRLITDGYKNRNK